MKKLIIASAATLVYIIGFWYLATPALNFSSGGLWFLILSAQLIFLMLYAIMFTADTYAEADKSRGSHRKSPRRKDTTLTVSSGLFVFSLIIVIILGISGADMFNASTYVGVVESRVKSSSFLNDVKEETQITDIALMDTASAEIIGNRQMGSLSSLVSQFKTSDYSTITVNGQPVKVSALAYVDFFRYNSNKNSGIPGYIKVNPVTQKADYIAFKKPLKYVPSAYFGYDLKRHIHSQYPGSIVTEFFFELDEEQNPYYVCPYYVYKAGVFGAKDVGGAIIVDPVTGSMRKYALADVPEWVDRVYDGDLLTEQYNWYGTLKNGFWNSVFSKKGCVVTTDNYGYKSFDDDTWVFTGVTSVTSDESNVGFVLMNSRTGMIHYYDIYGAEEYSAMSAAEGQVQNLQYKASFPSVININNEPVYIMVLKDSGGLTKMYALVGLKDYSIVATGETQQEAMAAYKKKIGLSDTGASASKTAKTVTVKIEKIQYAEVDGNTYAYLIAGGKAYKLSVRDNEKVVLCNVGDTVSLKCSDTTATIVEAMLA